MDHQQPDVRGDDNALLRQDKVVVIHVVGKEYLRHATQVSCSLLGVGVADNMAPGGTIRTARQKHQRYQDKTTCLAVVVSFF
jgi:hypothetical protein